MNPIHSGKVEKGKLILNNPNRYLVHLCGLEGREVELILRKRKKQRTLQQDRYYFGVVVKCLMNKTGYNKQQMHDALKEKFASTRDEKTGLLIIESTATMDTKRFIEYCDEIKQWADEFFEGDCYIPSPNEVSYDDEYIEESD